jgi:hypothetical protein
MLTRVSPNVGVIAALHLAIVIVVPSFSANDVALGLSLWGTSMTVDSLSDYVANIEIHLPRYIVWRLLLAGLMAFWTAFGTLVWYML